MLADNFCNFMSLKLRELLECFKELWFPSPKGSVVEL